MVQMHDRNDEESIASDLGNKTVREPIGRVGEGSPREQ